jgi:hypothetical protein
MHAGVEYGPRPPVEKTGRGRQLEGQGTAAGSMAAGGGRERLHSRRDRDRDQDGISRLTSGVLLFFLLTNRLLYRVEHV